MSRRMWTALEIRQLIEWRHAGAKVATIAKRLNRSPGSIRRQLCQQGIVICPDIKPRRKPGQLIIQAKKLLLAGRSVVETATYLDVSHSAVSRIRSRLGIPAATRQERGRLAWVFRKARGDKMPNRWVNHRRTTNHGQPAGSAASSCATSQASASVA